MGRKRSRKRERRAAQRTGGTWSSPVLDYEPDPDLFDDDGLLWLVLIGAGVALMARELRKARGRS